MIKGEVRIMGKEGNRRKYDSEFKKEAVRLIVERGLSVKKVVEDLGIHPNCQFSNRDRPVMEK